MLLAGVDAVDPCNGGPEWNEEEYEGPVCLPTPQSLRHSLEGRLPSTLLDSGEEYSGTPPPNRQSYFSQGPPPILET